MKRPGIVRINLTRVSAEGLWLNALVISGNDGAIVAPAITVIILQKRMVNFTSDLFFKSRFINLSKNTGFPVFSSPWWVNYALSV